MLNVLDFIDFTPFVDSYILRLEARLEISVLIASASVEGSDQSCQRLCCSHIYKVLMQFTPNCKALASRLRWMHQHGRLSEIFA